MKSPVNRIYYLRPFLPSRKSAIHVSTGNRRIGRNKAKVRRAYEQVCDFAFEKMCDNVAFSVYPQQFIYSSRVDDATKWNPSADCGVI